jgi:hypothetical protein
MPHRKFSAAPLQRTKPLILSEEIIAINGQKRMKHTNTLCMQNVGIFYVTIFDTHNSNCAPTLQAIRYQNQTL